MSVALILGVGLVGGAGAIARFVLDGTIAARAGRSFPWGTLTVNLTGAFLLGALAGAGLGGDTRQLAGAGVLGSFTTFSTWALESHRLGEDGRMRSGVANFLISLVLGVAVAWLGRELGASL